MNDSQDEYMKQQREIASDALQDEFRQDPGDSDPEKLKKAEEALQNLMFSIARAREEAEDRVSNLAQICETFIAFLQEKPEPPLAWQERMRAHGGKFDYHQIVLPEEYVNPDQEDDISLANLAEREWEVGCQALEHFLITRNHFIFSNGHRPSIAAPKPLLMLESHPEDPEIDWDCTFNLFADGSFQAYNLDKDHDEVIEVASEAIIQEYAPLLGRLVWRVARDGEDYGHLHA